ncbi:ThiF family adenylyltransferase [Psychrosphaera sp.]|nr:ThiF family adenylyltransferase [Psychrosphaera sp.]
MFDYNEAFSRNIGWVTESEQNTLRNATVAIAGMGGVGASHAIDCSRLGIGNIKVSDLDDYDVANFNRQAGAFMSTVGMPKSEVMVRTIKDINPECNVENFDTGISLDNLDEFLKGVDVYIDSLDIFALEIRRAVFKRCYELGIPAITAAPMGLGGAMLCFTKDSMKFEDYFDFKDAPASATDDTKDQTFNENIIRFVCGVSPSVQQRHYLVEQGSVNFLNKKVPSAAMGISLATGILCSNVFKLLLKRGEVITAPRGLHFDAYRNKLIKTWRPFGNRNPLQKYMFKVIKGMLDKQ